MAPLGPEISPPHSIVEKKGKFLIFQNSVNSVYVQFCMRKWKVRTFFHEFFHDYNPFNNGYKLRVILKCLFGQPFEL